ncbi:MAG: NMT1/THI5 like domain-containing protein [Spirochaetes bacterium]|nr:MAG: NMT1/THI5 like domain-containing protein [Spirochaetota bacterium]
MLLLAISSASAQAKASSIIISILKGPSGIAATWMLAAPPDTGNVKLEFLYAGSADLVTAKLISGEIAAGVLPVNVAAKLHASGIPLKVVAVVGNGMVKFLSVDPSVSSLGQLKGSTIHIAGQRATPDYLFRYLMAEEGLVSGKDYFPQYNLAFPEVASQIAAKKITHAVLPEPFATQALSLNPSLRSPIDLDALWKGATPFETYPMSLLVSMPQLYEKNPQALTALTEAYAVSVGKTNAFPRETGILAESFDLGMKAAIAQKAIPNSAYVFDRSARSRSSIDALLGIFITFDPQSIGGRMPSDSFYSLLTP